MRVLDRWILEACHRLDAIGWPGAILVLACTCIVGNVAMAAGILLPLRAMGVDLGMPSGKFLLKLGYPLAVLIIAIAIPLLETWLMQVAPFFVVRHWSGRPAVLVVTSAVLFAGGHALNSPGHALTQISGGLVLGFTYFWASRRPPAPRPVLATWAVHGLNNLFAVSVLFTLSSLTPR